MKEIEICVIVILGVVGLAWAGTDPECPAGTWDNATTTGIAPNEITTHQCEYCAKGKFCSGMPGEAKTNCASKTFSTDDAAATSACEAISGSKWDAMAWVSKSELPKAIAIGKFLNGSHEEETCPKDSCPTPNTEADCPAGSVASSDDSICSSCGKGEVCVGGSTDAAVTEGKYVSGNAETTCAVESLDDACTGVAASTCPTGEYNNSNTCTTCPMDKVCGNKHDMHGCPKFSKSGVADGCILGAASGWGAVVTDPTTHCAYGKYANTAAPPAEGSCDACSGDGSKYCPVPWQSTQACPSGFPSTCTASGYSSYPHIDADNLDTIGADSFTGVGELMPRPTPSDVNYQFQRDKKYNMLVLNVPWTLSQANDCTSGQDCSFRYYFFTQQANSNDLQHTCQGYTHAPETYYDHREFLVCRHNKYRDLTVPFGYGRSTWRTVWDNDRRLDPTAQRHCMAGTYSNMGFPYCRADIAGYHTYRPHMIGDCYEKKYYCQNGYFCTRVQIYDSSTSASFEKRCPAGTYMKEGDPFLGVVYEWQNCMECPSGYYCPGNNQVIECPAGNICKKGASTVGEMSCPTGTTMGDTSPKQVSASECTACAQGKYCEQGEEPIDCPKGYWCPVFTTNQFTFPMDRGTYKDALAQTLNTAADDCKGAPGVGSLSNYCRRSSTAITPCPGGTYQPHDNIYLGDNIQCLFCPPAQDCADTADTAYTANDYTVVACPAGKYCPLGATRTPPPGTSPSSGKQIYESSVVGETWYLGVKTSDCTDRTVCLKGTTHLYARLCPEGQKTNSSGTGCETCTGTELCLNPDPVAACPADTACKNGLIHQCDPDQKPHATDGSCVSRECILGEYIDGGCTSCHAGAHCTGGSTTTATSCVKGKYSPIDGASYSTDCVPCPFGSQCKENSTESACPAGEICCGQAIGNLGFACTAAWDTTKATCADESGNLIYICDGGAGSTPRICEHGTYPNTDATPGTSCVDAAAGLFSMGGQTSAQVDANECSAGYYCTGKATSEYQFACPELKYNAATKGTSGTSCSVCGAGNYCMKGSSSEEGCPKGYYCLNTVGEPWPLACPKGTFKNETGTDTEANCDVYGDASSSKCPAGKACIEEGLGEVADSFLDCESGYYCTEGATTTCPTDDAQGGNVCPTGGYCEAGKEIKTKCPAGKFNMFKGSRSLANCIQCTPGQYCEEDSTIPTGDCKKGFYCPLESDNSENQTTQAGYFSKAGSPGECECYKGTFSAGGSETCSACPAGSYCNKNVIVEEIAGVCPGGKECPVLCPAGEFCPEGSINPQYCPIGTSHATAGESADDSTNACIPCPGGKSCPDHGMDAPIDGCQVGYTCKIGTYSSKPAITSSEAKKTHGPCPMGQWCPVNVEDGTDCEEGTYNTDTVSTVVTDCRNCWNGYYCTTAKRSTIPDTKCDAGYKCVNTDKATTGQFATCGEGHYCPSGTMKQIPCAPGYTTPTVTNVCVSCGDGKFCPLIAQDAAKTVTDCPKGYSCPADTFHDKQIPCPQGTYKDVVGGSGILQTDCGTCTKDANGALPLDCADSTCTANVKTADCAICQDGKYCLFQGIDALSTNDDLADTCLQGYYCKKGAKYAQPGTIDDKTTGSMCEVGYYCVLKSSEMTKCPSEYYCDEEAMGVDPTTTTKKCLDGHMCKEQQISGAPMIDYVDSSSQGWICPKGSFCTGGYTKTDCLAGTYNPTKGTGTINYCLKCPGGSWCENAATQAPVTCTAGFLCPKSSTLDSDETLNCTAGNYCPAGTTQMISCPEGEYQDTQAESTCKSCTAGNYCPFSDTGGTTAEVTCPKGYKCPGAGMKAPEPCPTGTYQDTTGQTTCTDCGTGFFCPEWAMQDHTTCTAGFYCTGATLTAPTAICSDGKICPAGSQAEVDCTAGSFCAGRGRSAVVGTCPDGYWCPLNTKDPHTNMCSPGHYCPAGSFEEQNCPIHTYNDYTGSDTNIDCRSCPTGFKCETEELAIPVDPTHNCPAGKYCVTTGSIAGGDLALSETDCDKGYKCPAGVMDKIECLPGSFQNETGQDVCIACSVGKYCDYLTTHDPISGVIEEERECPQGYYCLGSTGNYENTPCPGGTYGAAAGLVNEAACTDCDMNYFCMSRALQLSSTNPCREGYECSAKTKYLDEASECTQNYYCPVGSSGAKVACADDKYTFITTASIPTTGGTTGTDCLDCPPGKICSGHNTHDPCTATNFCAGNAAAVTTCPAGSYCPGTGVSQPSKCARGTYSAAGAAACTKCTAGKYCPDYGTTDSAEANCPEHHTCPTDIVCPGYLGNTFCDTLLPTVSIDTVLEHVVGSYKSVPCSKGKVRDGSASDCVDCSKGRWCWPGIDTATNDQGDCEAGYVCQGGAFNPRPFNIKQVWEDKDGETEFATYNGPAALGHKTAAGDTANDPCLAGSFLNSAGGTVCMSCPPGFFCAGTKITKITIDPDMRCTGGKVCGQGAEANAISDAAVTDCSIGKQCPLGTAAEIDCPDGTHTTATSQSACGNVPSNKYRAHADGTTAIDCLTGNTNCDGGRKYEPKCPFKSWGDTGNSACTDCPAGKYCIDGTADPDCTAGFFCQGSADYPSPTSLAINGGIICPEGGYCLHGAATQSKCPCACDGTDTTQACCSSTISSGSCPPADVITCTTVYEPSSVTVTEFLYFIGKTGGRQGLDCIPCAPGFYCDQTTAFDCPVGQYCPAETDVPVNCSEGTWTSNIRNEFKEDCDDCPEGHFCNSTGISTLPPYQCSKGNYCYERMMFTEVPCPAGTYRNETEGKRMIECGVCPAGFKCDLETIDPVICEDKQLCEEGTSIPSPCPGGYYCSLVTNFQKTICPKNNYCPINSSEPIACTVGQLCPLGSELPIKCTSGFYSKAVEGEGLEFECTICPKGTYSEDGKWEKCKECTEGYVCEEGCRLSHPYDKALQQGYQCPKGHYCPAGSYDSQSCPTGTYNPTLVASHIKDCKLCEKDTYNDKEGQPACLTCGNSAWSELGEIDCTPYGKNRAFLKSDASCRCLPKYEFVENGVKLSEDSSRKDCQPIVYPRVPYGDVRDIDGNPTSKSDCSKACSGGTGKRNPVSGICVCDATLTVDKICNRNCINTKPIIKVGAGGKIVIYEPGANDGTEIDMTQAENIDLSFMRDCTGTNCRMSNAGFNQNNIFSKYGLSDSVDAMYTAPTNSSRMLKDANNYKRREMATSSSDITDPLICINEEDTVMFEIGAIDHYPVYKKDSLLNSNGDFDYGAFKTLEAQLVAQKEAGETSYTKSFAYTFQDPGNYVFVDSADSEKVLVVSVKPEAERCPDDVAYIQTRTSEKVATLGIALDDDLQLEPDYVLLAILVSIFIIMLLLLLLGMKYFVAKSWKGKDSETVYYRSKNNRFNFAKLAFLRSKKPLAEPIDPAAPLVDVTTNREILLKEENLGNVDEDFISDDEDPESLRAMEDLDLAIVEKILERYREYKIFLRKEVFPVNQKHSGLLGEMADIFNEMKFMLKSRFDVLLEQNKFDLDYAKVDGCTVNVETDQMEAIDRNRQDIPVIKLNEELEDEYELLLAKKKKDEAEFKLGFIKGESGGKGKGEENEWQDRDDAYRKRDDKSEVIKKLGDMSNLSELERRQLMEDYEHDLLNLEGILSQERALQEVDLRKMLRDSRKRRGKKGSKMVVSTSESHLADASMEVIEGVGEEDAEKVEKTIAEEKEKAVDELNRNTLEKVELAKGEFMDQMGAKTDKEKEMIMKAHDQNWQKIVAQIEDDRAKQEAMIQKMLAKRKQRLLKQVKKQPSTTMQEGRHTESMDYEEDEIQQIIDEEMQKLTMNNELVQGGDGLLEVDQIEQRERMQSRHEKDIVEIENEIETNVGYEIEKETEKKTKELMDQTKTNMRRFQDERRKLNDKVMITGDKEERKKLLEKIEIKEKEMADLIDAEKNAQDSLLKEQLARRKLAKMRKMGAIEDKMKTEKLDMHVKHMEEKQTVQSDDTLQNILLIIQKLQKGDGNIKLAQAQIQEVFDRMIGDKHGRELSSLLARQFAELEEQLRTTLKKGIVEKLMDKEEIKKKYHGKLQQLMLQKGQLDDKDLDRRAKELKLEEANELREADIHASIKAKKEESLVRQNLEDKHANEFIDLKERQIREKEELMGKLFGLLQGEAKEFKTQLRTLKEQREKDRSKKKKKIDLEKKLILDKYERDMQDRFHDFEEILVKQREAEREILNKKGNIERILKERKLNFDLSMKKQAMINPDQQKIIMDSYARELMELEDMMENERNRQFLQMKEKMDKRNLKRERDRRTQEKAMQYFVGGVDRQKHNEEMKKQEKMEQFTGNLDKDTIHQLEHWKIDLIEGDRLRGDTGATTFAGINIYMDEIKKHDTKETEGVFLDETQYWKYWKILEKTIALEEYLNQLRAIRAMTELEDISELAELFSAEFFDFEHGRTKASRIGGGFRVLDEGGNPLQRFYKMLGSEAVRSEIRKRVDDKLATLRPVPQDHEQE